MRAKLTKAFPVRDVATPYQSIQSSSFESSLSAGSAKHSASAQHKNDTRHLLTRLAKEILPQHRPSRMLYLDGHGMLFSRHLAKHYAAGTLECWVPNYEAKTLSRNKHYASTAKHLDLQLFGCSLQALIERTRGVQFDFVWDDSCGVCTMENINGLEALAKRGLLSQSGPSIVATTYSYSHDRHTLTEHIDDISRFENLRSRVYAMMIQHGYSVLDDLSKEHHSMMTCMFVVIPANPKFDVLSVQNAIFRTQELPTLSSAFHYKKHGHKQVEAEVEVPRAKRQRVKKPFAAGDILEAQGDACDVFFADTFHPVEYVRFDERIGKHVCRMLAFSDNAEHAYNAESIRELRPDGELIRHRFEKDAEVHVRVRNRVSVDAPRTPLDGSLHKRGVWVRGVFGEYDARSRHYSVRIRQWGPNTSDECTVLLDNVQYKDLRECYT